MTLPDATNTRVIQYLGDGLQPGTVGVVVARTGVGKSALVVQIALDALLRDVPVLHVTLRDTVDHIRAYYDEIFRAIGPRVGDRAQAMVQAERKRMIHSYRGRAFDAEQLRANLAMLRDLAHFEPQLVVVDGLDAADFSDHATALASLAADLELPLWCTVRALAGEVEGVAASLCAACGQVLVLDPRGDSVHLTLREASGEIRELPLRLDPTTMLVVGDEDALDEGHPALEPSECTLYSGGANGTEATFGLAAERHGLYEVNFTFEGHRQIRTRGRYLLAPRELAAGDVSLVYVSRRLNRTYSEGSLIRKVLQTLWHMVSKSEQVFVVGSIQKDGTVVGGTGWSVELARMWNKELWVFDQERKAWHRWDGEDWVVGVPVIRSTRIAGTGTRYLTDEGQEAIYALFERSFAS